MKRNPFFWLSLVVAALFACALTACAGASDDDDDDDDDGGGGMPDNQAAVASCEKLQECMPEDFTQEYSGGVAQCANELDQATSGGDDGTYCYEFCDTNVNCDEYFACVVSCADG